MKGRGQWKKRKPVPRQQHQRKQEKFVNKRKGANPKIQKKEKAHIDKLDRLARENAHQ